MSSIAAHLVEAGLRLLGPKRLMNDPERFSRTFGAAGEPALPSDRLKRRLSFTERREHGFRVFDVGARQPQGRGRILYIHGGAYVQELAGIHWRMVEKLIERTKGKASVPVYPLAPAAGWEEMSGPIVSLFGQLADEAGAENVSIVGDSSGGGLALSVTMALRDGGGPLPSSLVLFSPWLDLTMSDPRQVKLDRVDPMLGLPGLKAAGRAYAGQLATADPRVSPLYGSFERLPPMMILTGTHDILNSDAHAAAAKAFDAGSELVLREYADMIHVWPALPVPEASPAFDEAAAFITTHWAA